ncbi:MAG: transcription-repair coupling factor [Candidatus Metalachnospira sp.]|nr:transcription-repair coupling factor [Candidatus Metalachnospira sp.]
MKWLTEPLTELADYRYILDNIKLKNTPVLTTGVIDVQKTQLIYSICEHTGCNALIITDNESSAKSIYNDLVFLDDRTSYYPAKDFIFYSADVHSSDITKQRFKTIDDCLKGEVRFICATAESLFERLMPKNELQMNVIELKEGDIVSLDDIQKKLIFMGYERSEIVEGVGQFAVRGGIIDVYSPVHEMAVRIELWDDEVDSVRAFDAMSQRSVGKIDRVRIFPVKEILIDECQILNAADKIEADMLKAFKNYEKKDEQEAAENIKRTIGEVVDKLRNGINEIANFINYTDVNTVSLFDYLPENTIVFYDEPKRIKLHVDSVYEEFESSMKERLERGYILPKQMNLIFDMSDIYSFSSKFREVLMCGITQIIPDFKIKAVSSFTVKSSTSFNNKYDLFYEEIKYLKNDDYRVVVFGGGESRCERIAREMNEAGIEAVLIDYKNDFIPAKGSIYVCHGKLSKGFEYPDIKFAVFSLSEISGEYGIKKRKKYNKKGKVIESFTDLKVGDYVVHESHGIGVYRGLEKITVDGINKDYLKISYNGGSNLFVPVNQMDLVQKYIGSDGARPKLSKLGGQDWGKMKSKVRAAVAILAEDLIEVYAKREAAKGYTYSYDTSWQKEFEENFEFTETDDQLNAVEDIKHDMETGKVMDRLVCGDVGYGKTEVAIRAAFKTVQDGKQVAYLVPTTILAQQHFMTFTKRMSQYPVQIELLNRFRTAKEQKQTLKKLESGMSDIVIGTHRLLSKDVKFRDLGLIIVDEEQRFGVAHKEKLKRIKENVNVLTLTATPIPRTLHMSLAGIRDMSLLEEPPEERMPVQTFVMESNEQSVRDAIHREVARGGQVYYLHNRIENIYETAAKIQKLVPKATVQYAHGRMSERELEGIMEDFIEGEIDVLVCTTIIETGLDISNVNTIIIQDSDRMGLSQLYQLRGRVGRSNRTSYAYFMYRKDKVLQETAEKRLQTIREFTEFGSGFKIAMRDLEIRGAGSLLGAEQHGHMETVGYDLYCKLLDEAVCKLKGEVKADSFETSIDISVSAYIPDYYIQNEEQRLEIYKKISLINGTESFYDIQEEIEDRYGDLPKCVQTLLDVALVKYDAHQMDIISIAEKQKNIIIIFRANARISTDALTKLLTMKDSPYMFTASAEPYVTIKTSPKSGINALQYVKNFIQSLREVDIK